MRIGIIGAGALGSVIGGTLAEAGNDVLLVNRNHSFVETINRSGLTMRTDGRDRVVAVRAAIPVDVGAPADLVIVLVKSFHTAEAVTQAIELVGPDTTVLSLQNGSSPGRPTSAASRSAPAMLSPALPTRKPSPANSTAGSRHASNALRPPSKKRV